MTIIQALDMAFKYISFLTQPCMSVSDSDVTRSLRRESYSISSASYDISCSSRSCIPPTSFFPLAVMDEAASSSASLSVNVWVVDAGEGVRIAVIFVLGEVPGVGVSEPSVNFAPPKLGGPSSGIPFFKLRKQDKELR